MTGTRVQARVAWAAERHSLAVEASGVLVGDRRVAVRHAHDVASLEQSTHIYAERHVQAAAHALPASTDA